MIKLGVWSYVSLDQFVLGIPTDRVIDVRDGLEFNMSIGIMFYCDTFLQVALILNLIIGNLFS